MTLQYDLEILGTAVFAISGVFAVARRGLDVIGALALGIVTALGGGTVRDVILAARPFWTVDTNYLWAATAGALLAFLLGGLIRSTQRAVLYADGLGAALFAVAAVDKTLSMHFPESVAVMMGILTGIGGGLIRDVLAGRPTLLMSRDIYATPILLGCVTLVGLRHFAPGMPYSAAIAIAVIFGIRVFAIYRQVKMPLWLTHEPGPRVSPSKPPLDQGE
jgi:uncharacterized membrane protein YeiH